MKIRDNTLNGYQHYIFDFDYTLFDTSKGMEKCYREALKAIKVSYDPEMLDIYVKESLKATFSRYETNFKFSIFEKVFLETSKKCMCKLSVIYSDTKECLETLYQKNKHLSVVTGKPRQRVLEILEKYNLESFIDEIVGYGEYCNPKPNPESLNMCIKRVNIPKRFCVYIGDSPYDVLAAQNAGIDGILIDRTGINSNAINSLKELIE